MEPIEVGIGGLSISASSTVSQSPSEGPIKSDGKEIQRDIESHKENFSLSLPMDKDISTAIQSFLQPLKQEILKEKEKQLNTVESRLLTDINVHPPLKRDVPMKLLQSLCRLIWEPDMLYLSKGLLCRTYNTINLNFSIEEGQSDLEDFLEYKSSEILAYKAVQVFIALALPDLALFAKELSNFRKLMQDVRVARDSRCEAACWFLYNTFKSFYEILADEFFVESRLTLKEKIQDFNDLALESKCYIETFSVIFIKFFRLRSKERITKLKRIVEDDGSSYEWCLYLAEILRLKRRESATSRPQWASQDEMDALAKAISIAPDNPFVRLSVIDTIIGSVRDAHGRFFCGDIRLDNMEDAMRYLQQASEKLVTEFPKNVLFNSIISDYFARYVPLLYFDVDYSHRLLMAAYKLNPFNSKTTHRLGILYRMSLGRIEESTLWFEKTIELDPNHFPATMEYIKSIMGQLEKYNAIEFMKSKLESAEAKGWSPFEVGEIQFYLGIACFMKNMKDDTLKWWMECLAYSDHLFTLVDLQDAFLFYEWDTRLVSTDKLRLWVQQKRELLRVDKRDQTDLVDYNSSQRRAVERIFGIMLGRVVPVRKAWVDPNHEPSMPNFPAIYLEHFLNL